MKSLPPLTVTSLNVQSLGTCNTTTLEVKSESVTNTNSPLTVQSDGTANVPSLQVQTQGITKVPSLQVKSEGVTKVSSLDKIASSLQSIPSTLEIKTEAVSTTGSAVTSPVQHSPDAGISQSPAGSFVTTQTVHKVNVPTTGTGSVTAIPNAYTNAVTTTASTTTTTAAQEGVTTCQDPSILGKRIRRQSTKYEDYEQQTMIVRPLCESHSGECCLPSIHVRVWVFVLVFPALCSHSFVIVVIACGKSVAQ